MMLLRGDGFLIDFRKLASISLIGLMLFSFLIISPPIPVSATEGCYTEIGLNNADNSYVMFVNVSYSSGGDITCNGHCNSNFSDVRFENLDRTVFCDYWIEKKTDGEFAWVWVKLPSDIEDDNRFILSYGVNDTSMSSGIDTFQYFEDWTSDHTSQNYWNYNSGDGTTVYYTENYYNNTYTYDSRLRYRMNISEWHCCSDDAIQIRFQKCRSTPVGDCDRYAELNLKSKSVCGIDSSNWGFRVSSHTSGSSDNVCCNDTIPYDSSKFYIFDHTIQDSWSNITVYDDDTLSILSNGDLNLVPAESDNVHLTVALSQSSGWDFEWRDNDYLFVEADRGSPISSYIDWMFVSTYSDVEPTISSQSDENSSLIIFINVNGEVNNSVVYSLVPTFTWSRDNETSQYNLVIDDNSDFSSTEVNITDINIYNYPVLCTTTPSTVSYTLGSNLSGGTYYYRVRGYTL